MDDVLMEVATNLQQQMGPILCNLHANWVGSMFDKANHAIFFLLLWVSGSAYVYIN